MSNSNETSGDKSQDLRSRLKQFAQPLVDSIDTRLRDQVDHRVDERVDASLSARLLGLTVCTLSLLAVTSNHETNRQHGQHHHGNDKN